MQTKGIEYKGESRERGKGYKDRKYEVKSSPTYLNIFDLFMWNTVDCKASYTLTHFSYLQEILGKY